MALLIEAPELIRGNIPQVASPRYGEKVFKETSTTEQSWEMRTPFGFIYGVDRLEHGLVRSSLWLPRTKPSSTGTLLEQFSPYLGNDFIDPLTDLRRTKGFQGEEQINVELPPKVRALTTF